MYAQSERIEISHVWNSFENECRYKVLSVLHYTTQEINYA